MLPDILSDINISYAKYMNEQTKKVIENICVYGLGYFYATDENPIEMFFVNGEMALVAWYRQGNTEWNGKYVTQVVYKA